VIGFRKRIGHDERGAFARGFTESLIEYALGRPFGFVDEGPAMKIVNRAREKILRCASSSRR